MGRPWRVTISCDGIGATHDKIRGKEHFFDAVETTIQTLLRLRREHKLGYIIRLKTVIMEHNLHDVAEMARYARAHGLEVFYQPIEQNYNTPEDPRWFEHSDNWPKDRERAVAAVQELIELKRQGFPIANTEHQLEVMIPYFRDPERLLILTQSHSAHDKPLCSALTTMQIQSNGDVKSCWCMDPIGNITQTPIRQIWESRPRWWESGCCLGRRMSEAEKAFVGLTHRLLKPARIADRIRARRRCPSRHPRRSPRSCRPTRPSNPPDWTRSRRTEAGRLKRVLSSWS